MTPFSVLFYRFFFAAILMGVVTKVRKAPFTLPKNCRIPAVFAGILMALTCIFWFLAFRIMDSGISAALLAANLLFIGTGVAACFKRKNYDLIPAALCMPFYWMLISIAAWKGFIQIFTKPFYWEKTTHGLTTTQNSNTGD